MNLFRNTILTAFFTTTCFCAPPTETPDANQDALQKTLQLKAIKIRDAEVRTEIERIQVTIGQLQGTVNAIKQRFALPEDFELKEMSLTFVDQDHYTLGKKPVDKKTLEGILRELSGIYPGGGVLSVSGYEAQPPQALANVIEACFDAHYYNIKFIKTK